MRPAAAAAAALMLAGAACGSTERAAPTTTTSTSTVPRCSAPPAGVGPDATATLTEQDGAGPWCLHEGDVLTVYLKVAPDDVDHWQPISVSSDTVLTRRSSGVQTLVRGVTGAVFLAAHPGIATVRSARSGGAAWRADIVVTTR